MTGPEHYREAAKLISRAEHEYATSAPGDSAADRVLTIQQAQVHATLALAAATAADLAHDVTARNLWHEAVQA